MMSWRVMALVAVPGVHRDRKPRPIGDVGIPQRVGMLAAGAMAVFALDVREVLQRGGHGVPVSVGEHRRKLPASLSGDVVKPAVDCIGIGVIAHGVALEAGLAVMPKQAVDSFCENL